jgi:cytochrome P450
MASLLRHIFGDPQIKQKLIDDLDLVRAAVEETLRLNTPLHMFGRTTKCPVRVEGAELPERSFVMLNWASAKRNPETFEKPDEFRHDRSPNPHVAFGFWIHTCTGAQLARIELEVVAKELLTRVPDMELDGDPPDYHFCGGNLAELPELQARFEPQ